MILQDKVALVTGGTAGIGRAVALAFAKRLVRASVFEGEEKLNEVIAFVAAGAKVVFFARCEAECETTSKGDTFSFLLYFSK